ncbi:MAG: hypothetical protein AAF518_27660 [Spirochaetota bacterium]
MEYFEFFRKYNLIEFRSFLHPLDEEGILSIVTGMIAFLDSKLQVPSEEIACVLFTAKRPDVLFYNFNCTRKKPGVYQITGLLFLPIDLVVVEELPMDLAYKVVGGVQVLSPEKVFQAVQNFFNKKEKINPAVLDELIILYYQQHSRRSKELRLEMEDMEKRLDDMRNGLLLLEGATVKKRIHLREKRQKRRQSQQIASNLHKQGLPIQQIAQSVGIPQYKLIRLFSYIGL